MDEDPHRIFWRHRLDNQTLGPAANKVLNHRQRGLHLITVGLQPAYPGSRSVLR